MAGVTFADIIAPLTPEAFFRDHYGKRPVHIPASGRSRAARAVLDWAEFGALLGIQSHWTEPNIRLILNSQPITPDFYMDEAVGMVGTVRRASAAKVELFLAMGASMVANAVHEISAPVRRFGATLSDTFAGKMGANAYCSFKDIQAFNSHYDLSEIFAVHCEGEKVWRLYEGRAEEPVTPPQGPDAQQRIDRAKGRVMAEVRMRPGDLLYMPRGWYHDALASSEAALHVTYAVTPLYGRILFRLLEEEAMRDPAFRAYLPDGRAEEGRPLADRLRDLGRRIARLAESPAVRDALLDRQQALVERDAPVALPERPVLRWYAATGRPHRLERGDAGWTLHAGADVRPLGRLGDAAAWALSRPAFSRQEVAARFPALPEDGVAALCALLLSAGLYAEMDGQPGL